MRTAAALRQGYSAGELRGPKWERVTHDVVRQVVSESRDQTWQRIGMALAVSTAGCVLGGWASLAYQGNDLFTGTRNGQVRDVLIHCGRGSRVRSRPGIDAFRGQLLAEEVIDLDQVQVTTLARALFDEMRLARSLRGAVMVADMGLSTTAERPHTSLAALESVIGQHHKVRGVAKLPQALGLVSTRSASPWESRTRLLAHLDAGLTALRVNEPVFSESGQLLGIADLLDEESGLVIESDGAHHREVHQHADDNRREERFERAGLIVVRVTPVDLQDRWQTVSRMRSAHRDALRSPRGDWTLERPSWWSSWPHAPRWD